MVRERDIQGKTVGYARSRRVIARKLDFGDGWPDYMLLYEGRTLFIEFKRSGMGRLRPLQEHVTSLLRKSGFVVFLINDVNVGYGLIDAFVGNCVVRYADTLEEQAT